MLQVRMPIAEVPNAINEIVAGRLHWQSVVEKYGLFDASANEKE
jgi:hypothetical protein